jgi:outer membrane protein assembly factor BamB
MVPAPTPFATADGKLTGWKTRIPGGRPLATPAVAGGRVFVGGGFGSYEFYAFDADSGALAWEYRTHDDGPTAAVVADDLVVFNTESCELEVLTTEGRPVWKKWLGDPLMSMPAVGGGRVFMAYPDSRKDHQHYLACFDLRTGHEHWRSPIAGEIITAPVLAGGHVYLTTLDGTVYCFEQQGGRTVWRDNLQATSSPVVWNGRCYFSRRAAVPQPRGAQAQQTESLAACSLAGAGAHDFEATRRAADWLDYGKRKARSPREKLHEEHDAHVGFAFSKGSAKIEQAMRHLGHGSVAGCWAYQGSKPFAWRDRLYSALGDTLECVDPETQEVRWKHSLYQRPQKEELLDSMVTPPALVNGKAFVGTVEGDVYCLAAEGGDLHWKAALGEPVLFQPAVARGRVYLATYTGTLYCLETGDPNDDGWAMWGGDAAHNGLVQAAAVARAG